MWDEQSILDLYGEAMALTVLQICKCTNLLNWHALIDINLSVVIKLFFFESISTLLLPHFLSLFFRIFLLQSHLYFFSYFFTTVSPQFSIFFFLFHHTLSALSYSTSPINFLSPLSLSNFVDSIFYLIFFLYFLFKFY